ncbi:hypothetical protein CELL_03419 [Cellulomonas sp. T2.31MG-18]|uniref:DoxX family protein n=1 Tax=Cellulomonas sp. T2.31MG-18 TaxID=3157619 RepID=UPI0035E98756
MLLRRVARPMFASWFLVEGLDAVRHPSSHAAAAREGVTALRARLARYAHLSGAERVLDDRYGVDVQAVLDQALGRELSDRQLTTAVRLHGAAMLVAGGMLATGRAPRTSALALAALAAPVALVNAPAGRGVTVATLDQPSARAVRRRRFWSAVSATGGALLAAADHEGRPGLAWRWQNAWDTRAAVKDAVREATADD